MSPCRSTSPGPREGSLRVGRPGSGRPTCELTGEAAAELRAPPKPAASELAWPLAGRSRRILGVRVDGTSYAETGDAVLELARSGLGGVVCCATAHTLVEALDDPDLRRSLDAAERVTPDGMPLVWGLRWLGVGGATRVYGPDLTLVVCRRAARAGLPVGFYGGRPEVLEALQRRLAERCPGLRIAFAHSPPFRALSAAEDREQIEAIEESGCRVLFVGLGCPKQERWMAAHREKLSCVQLGVGAAFDFHAGSLAQAPGWMQAAGLEWLFRLLVEPRRLWRRYLIQNPRFALHFGLELAAAARGRA